MKLNIQKRLAASILKVSPKKISLDVTRMDELKDAITRADIKSLIKDKAIRLIKPKGTSKSRIRKARIQIAKGRRKGPGSRKSSSKARVGNKRRWINHVRIQRKFLKNLRDKNVLEKSSYRQLYLKSKGGFFRSKRHLKIYIEERGLIK